MRDARLDHLRWIGAVTCGLLALAPGCGGGASRDVPHPTLSSGVLARPPCDEPRLVELDAWLAESPGDGELSVVPGLVEGCRLPPALAHALTRIGMLGGGEAVNAGLGIVEEDAALWTRACPRGPAVAIGATRGLHDPTFGPRQHAEALWSGCAVERLSIATAQEWLRAGPLAEVAIATAGWLREVGVSPARVRAYARALAGLDAPSAPSPAQ